MTPFAKSKLAGLVEMDDSYFGAPKLGKRGRGAAGKAKVVVAVENTGDNPSFAKMYQIKKVSKDEINKKVRTHLHQGCIVRTDGWRAYGVFDSKQTKHEPVVVGSRQNPVKVLPWVHTLIANIKGNIRRVYPGVSSKHLKRYLPEVCYRFNLRF